MNSSLNRRQFLRAAGVAAVTAPFLSRRLSAAPGLPVLRHASFGAAGMAAYDLQSLCANPFVKLVAVAEVDLNRLGDLRANFPEVRVYQDWRQLLEKERDNIDSVNVSTPDHLHAPMALSAMQLGKHVYCQKPLAHDLHEVRVLTEYAREKRVVTQMGIQVHTMPPYRQAVALLQSGVVGRVKEVHTWSNKRWGDAGPPPSAADTAPAGFDWDLWLGGCSARPYVGQQYYHPENWRKRLDFGTGTFGDMGCHIFDPVFGGLSLTAPLTIRSEGPAPDEWNWAADARIHYVFPGSALTAEATLPLTWYDGTSRPPDDIIALVDDPKRTVRPNSDDTLEQGSIIVGTAGALHIPHVHMPRLFPREKFKDTVLPKVAGTNHWADWAEACVGGPGRPAAPFEYAGPLTETVLLGSVAVRFPHRTLQWNSSALRFENESAANELVRRRYRPGWQVGAL